MNFAHLPPPSQTDLGVLDMTPHFAPIGRCACGEPILGPRFWWGTGSYPTVRTCEHDTLSNGCVEIRIEKRKGRK